MNWISYSIISTVGFAGIALLIKKLTLFNIKPEVLNLYFWGLTAISFLIYTYLKKNTLQVPGKSWYWFLLLAIIAFVTNLFSVLALKTAPNPGYARAIQATQIILVTVISIFIFGSKIDPKAMIGIITVLIGIFLITTS